MPIQAKKPKKIKMTIEDSEEPPEPVNNVLVLIYQDLNKLQELSSSATVNMSDILNLHNSINTKIDQLVTRVDKLKK